MPAFREDPAPARSVAVRDRRPVRASDRSIAEKTLAPDPPSDPPPQRPRPRRPRAGEARHHRPGAPRSGADRAQVAARPLALRRPEISGGLQAFRIRQPECAQGRQRAPGRVRHLRQFQHGRGGREGQYRRRHRPDLRHADGAGLRRSLDRIRAARRCGEPSRRPFVRRLSAEPAGEVARRQAGDPGRRDLLVRRIQEEQPVLRRLLQPCGQGREDRRARGHLHVRRAGQPRAAADRRPAQRAAEALVGRPRPQRQQARRDRDHARAAARLRSLSHQGLRGRAPHRLRARQGLLGQGPAREHRAR